MRSRPTFYITTPIYYVNDKPHIGHVYTTTVCDVVARFHRLMGEDVFFLTGTDEHGLKVEKSATEAGITPQEMADRNAAEFESVMHLLHMSNDDFIRTTQERHVDQVEVFVKRLIDSGAVYLGEYEGWYDEGQEEYVTETIAADHEYKSPISGKPLVKAREKNYFFRLSAFQTRLEELLETNPDFVRPVARRNEVLGRLRDGLQDIPMSRTNFSWGIPVPDCDHIDSDEQHVIYVWVDALFNYITAIGLGDAALDEAKRSSYWPADCHMIGKEILFFHAVVWPAMLMALEIPLPKCIYAHSFWIREGRKMSKSLGNFIDLETIQNYVDQFGLDAWRWYLTSQGPLGSTDADFAHAKFVEVYNSDLANTFGNAVSRVINMIGKYFDGRVPEPGTYAVDGFDWPTMTRSVVDDVTARIRNFDLAAALNAALGLVRQVNAYVDATRPFSMAKEPERRDDLASVLYQCIESLRIASVLLWAVMPDRVGELWSRLGLAIEPGSGRSEDTLEFLVQWGGLKAGAELVKGEALFPRYVDE